MNIPNALDPAASLKEAFPKAVLDVNEFRGETTIVVDPKHIVHIVRYLRDTPGLSYNYLSDITAVDYWPESTHPGRFGVNYHLLSMLYARRLRVKVYLDEADPTVESIITVWPAANWLEREAYDLMGITFKGHPDLRRLQLPDDWQGHPHRRDYPLGYETIMFSFNAEEIMKHKPFAKE